MPVGLKLNTDHIFALDSAVDKTQKKNKRGFSSCGGFLINLMYNHGKQSNQLKILWWNKETDYQLTDIQLQARAIPF